MNYEWNINFLQNDPLGIQHTPSEFFYWLKHLRNFFFNMMWS